MSTKPKVLIVDDEPEIGGLLKLFLEDDFDVVTHTDPRKACEDVKKAYYDLVVSDIRMPYLSGHDVVQFIKGCSPLTEVVLITGHAQTEEDRVHATEIGAAGILFKPFGDPEKIVSYLRQIINLAKRRSPPAASGVELAGTSRTGLKPRVLVVDDEPDLVDVVLMLLSDEYEVDVFVNPIDALKAVLERPYACFITDLNMPQMKGKDVIFKLRQLLPQIPIIVMSGHSADDREVKEVLQLGVNALLPKPFPDPQEILSLIGKFAK